MPQTIRTASIYRSWSKLSPEQHFREIVRYAQAHNGFAVTINLKPEFEECLRNSEKPMRLVSKRFNAELNRLDLRHLPILMVLEATKPEGRLHLHGVYMSNGNSKLLIQKAMRRAAGDISGRQGSRQFSSKLVYAADGWKNYLHKDCMWTRRNLALSTDNQLWWTSHSMTALVREEYEAQRLGQKGAANDTLQFLIAN